MVASYSENHTKNVNTLCEQNVEICVNVKAGGTYSNHCALKDSYMDIDFNLNLRTICNLCETSVKPVRISTGKYGT
jgi:hypothetical protein